MYKIADSLKERFRKKERSDFIFLIVILFVALVMSVIIFLNTYVFFNVLVDGPSMEPTMYTGDVLMAVKTDEVKRGDIIVIDGEKYNSATKRYDWLIKRAIAFEGEKVEIKDGKVYINGNPLDEPYLPEGRVTEAQDWTGEITVGKDQIFYLGDNRGNSSDSRYEKYGTCDEDQIVGVVKDWALDVKWLSGFFYDVGKFFRGER